jgi:hypothetical protein
VFKRVLQRMRELVKAGQYVLTIHGADEMDADGLTIYDVEHCILSGRITRRQRERTTDEWKYLVEGRTLAGGRAVVVAKIGPTGKLLFITVYAL